MEQGNHPQQQSDKSSALQFDRSKASRRHQRHVNNVRLLLFLVVLALLPVVVRGSPIPNPIPDDPLLISAPEPTQEGADPIDTATTTTTSIDWWPYGEKTITTEQMAPSPTEGAPEPATTADIASSTVTSSPKMASRSSLMSSSSEATSASSSETINPSASATASAAASQKPSGFKIIYLTPVFAIVGLALMGVAIGLCRRRPSSRGDGDEDDEYPGLRERYFQPPLQDRGQYADFGSSGEKFKANKGDWDSDSEEETDDFDFGYGIRGMAAGKSSFQPSMDSEQSLMTVADGGGYIAKPSKRGERASDRSWLGRSKTNLAGVGGRWGRVELRDDSLPIPEEAGQADELSTPSTYADGGQGQVGLGIGGLQAGPPTFISPAPMSTAVHPSSMVSPPAGMLSPPFHPHLFYASHDSGSPPTASSGPQTSKRPVHQEGPYTALPPRSNRPQGGRALMTRSNPSKNLAISPTKPRAATGSRSSKKLSASGTSSSRRSHHRKGAPLTSASSTPRIPPSVNEGSEYSGHYYEDDEDDDHAETAAMMSQVDQILKKSLSDRALLSPTSVDISSPPPAPTPARVKPRTKPTIGEIPSPISSPAEDDEPVTEPEELDEDERIGRRNTQGKLALAPTAASGLSRPTRSRAPATRSGLSRPAATAKGGRASKAAGGGGGRPSGGSAIAVPKLTKTWPPVQPAGGGSPGMEENGLGIEQRLARLRRIEFGEGEGEGLGM